MPELPCVIFLSPSPISTAAASSIVSSRNSSYNQPCKSGSVIMGLHVEQQDERISQQPL